MNMQVRVWEMGYGIKILISTIISFFPMSTLL